jgi:hypothetical protein
MLPGEGSSGHATALSGGWLGAVGRGRSGRGGRGGRGVAGGPLGHAGLVHRQQREDEAVGALGQAVLLAAGRVHPVSVRVQ